MQGPIDGAHGMWHHQANEADDAAGGDTRRGEQRSAEVDDTPQAIDLGAEVVGGLIAKGNEIQ